MQIFSFLFFFWNPEGLWGNLDVRLWSNLDVNGHMSHYICLLMIELLFRSSWKTDWLGNTCERILRALSHGQFAFWLAGNPLTDQSRARQVKGLYPLSFSRADTDRPRSALWLAGNKRTPLSWLPPIYLPKWKRIQTYSIFFNTPNLAQR